MKRKFGLALAAIVSCSPPLDEDGSSAKISPHPEGESHLYTDVEAVNREIQRLYLEFLEMCEKNGSGAPLGEIVEKRDAVFEAHGCPPRKIRWLCNDNANSSPGASRGVMSERLSRDGSIPMKCGTAHRVQNR